jgi:hypothetical protein
MAAPSPFAAKLDLVLKALSLSRGRLAAELGVDKSVASRWASGAMIPSSLNLEHLTRLIASRHPGFTMLDWERELPELAERLGVSAPRSVAPVDGPLEALPLPFLEAARRASEQRAGAYEGFWRTTRPSAIMPGRFRHEFGMFRRAANGLVEIRMGCAGYSGDGWLLPLEGKLFTIVFDIVAQTPLFGVYNGVQQSRALSMNGLMLGAGLDVARTPTLFPTILDRIGDLTGDAEADEATYLEIIGREPMAPEGSISEDVANTLVRDTGPAAAALGGDLMMTAVVTAALARGEIGRTG